MSSGKTSAEGIKFDLSKVLRNGEPLIVLASLSLILAVFTFEHIDKFPNVYNHAVLASFSFIISFILVILSNIDYVSLENKVLGLAIRYGVFFFLAVGIVYLLLITYEFGKEHLQIFSFYQVWWLSFGAGLGFILFNKVLTKEIGNARGMLLLVAALQIFVSLLIGVGGLVASAIYSIEAFTSFHVPHLSPQIAANMYYYGFAGLGGTAFLESYAKRKEKRDAKLGAPIR